MISPDWFDRYVHRFELQRFPKGKQAQEALVVQVGEDSWALLEALRAPQAPPGVERLPLVALLRASCGSTTSSASRGACSGVMARR